MTGGGTLIEKHSPFKNEFELPRFTRSLRAFTNLEGPEKLIFDDVGIDELLRRARKQNRKVYQNDEVTWGEIKQKFKTNGQASRLLDELYHYTKELSKDQPKEIVEAMSAYLFQLFLMEDMVLQKHVHMLKEMYGPVTHNQLNKIFQVVHEIASIADDEIINSFQNREKKEENIFGKDIKFKPSSCFEWKPDCDILKKLCDLDSFTNDKYLENFTIKYEGSTSNDEKAKSKTLAFGRAWLIKELKKFYFNDDSDSAGVEDFADTIVNQLKLEKSNDELQNVLFEMLGFDRFELIQLLLKHRNDIVSNCHVESNMKDTKRPALSSQVTVLSEEEKINLKLARKEEKRNQKLMSRNRGDEDDDDSDFDPVELRYKRIEALNKNVPVISTSKPAKVTRKAVEFPHVYDSQDKAKQTAGFISGVKMFLPAGVEKKDKKTYEEVVIPISEQAPLEVGKNLVEVSSLNHIGRVAFEGIKTLNRIQSVVFETAYRTNENLLICAPTGAGKTNIALLTVVRQIEQHVENNVIKKDTFKIVYVAPMKALAAEMTRSFAKRLNPLGLTVKELTGDMQLTKAEIIETQMLITTPEKWDVVTRKGTGDVALVKLVKLLIMDEVHLLHGDRGPVVEALVARTLRQVLSSQSLIRIVGLSATLPNYLDVARFLRVSPKLGLFYFDSRFRPVPLSQIFIGVKATKPLQQMNDMDQVCYEKVLEQVQRGHQVMVFVHARNATIRTANVLKELATKMNQLHAFEPEESSMFTLAKKSISRVKNKQVSELFQYGFSCHHAGMLRADRSIIEKYFADGLIKVLVCTATLAWGVNLPAHAVVIRGTEIYDAKHGSFVDLGILDVLQIFGRAGRPQFDTSGVGIIITSYDKLSHYLSLLTDQFPIESNFINFLADNLNAEIALGTISNVDEAVEWLSYTYLFVRMRANPLVYGINYADVQDDPQLIGKRRELIHAVAKALDRAKMIRYNAETKDLNVTDLGRTASHFYIKYDTVEIFNDQMKDFMVDVDILTMISHAQEFHQLKVRDDELDELDNLARDYCELQVTGGSENLHGKVNILLQTYLSRGRVESFSLISDQSYIIQNAVRIVRGLFDIAIRKNNAVLTSRFLAFSKMFELQMWDIEHPLKQFSCFGSDVITKLQEKKLSIEDILEMDPREIGNILRNPKLGQKIQDYARYIPALDITPTLQPITRTVLRIRLKIVATFRWNDNYHGKSTEPFWIWIEDSSTNFIYHSEYFLITKKQVMKKEVQDLVMTIPLQEPLPSEYYVRAVSDRWLGSNTTEPLSFSHLTLPEGHPPHTDLLPLQPLPISALENPEWEALYKFTHFNPIQTQIFHCLYHSDNNVLLGAPTGSGKTIAAEIAIFRVFKTYPGAKVVYIAPLKALVRERIEDWKIRFERKLNRKVVELTGDVSPDIRAISSADVIVTTPEKWDGISRSWQTRNYVRDVALIVIDEIHLLGEDRGPVLEVIVSRTNFISSHTKRTLRIIGLSTALANAKDLADWLGIGQMGLYNFRPSVRPVPLEVHISGFPGKHYCPRMATMNRPTFQAIRQHSPTQPALVFVSSRRQTRLTALDLIAYLVAEDNSKQWLKMSEEEMAQIVTSTKDSNLKLTLAFGIGIHHAGLTERDRKTVEELFVNQKIQVLIATSTLAWGVNFPAHLVVIKGTEYFDGKLKRYVDMPITDVLQMMGRAGRPQYDEEGVAVVLVHDIKKNFYKKFLYEPFPVESSLLEVLPDHLNAEVVSGTIQTKQDALDYLTWTYFFRRLIKNPTYYKLEEVDHETINIYLSELVERTFKTLDEAYCIEMQFDDRTVETTSMGRIASFYYLSHKTMRHFRDTLRADLNYEELLQVLSDVHEYDQLPVRHNEDLLNKEFSKNCPLKVNQYTLDSPHTKAQLLFQAHFSRLQLPCVDYLTDLKSVLDQAIRILQAMIDVCAEQGWLASTLRVQQLMQMVIQGTWIQSSPLLTLPHVESYHLSLLKRKNPQYLILPKLKEDCTNNYNLLAGILRSELEESQIEDIFKVLNNLPIITVSLALHSDVDGEIKIEQPMSRHQWIKVRPNQEYALLVRLRRKNKSSEGLRAHTPRFPRGTDEGWFLTLGTIENKELLALKRISNVRGNVSTNSVTFYTPDRFGRYIYTVYIVSDCYMGLDQQFSVNLEVTDKLKDEDPPVEVNLEEKQKFLKVEENLKSDSDSDEPIGRGSVRPRNN